MMRQLILLFALVAPVCAILLFTANPWLALGLVFLSHMLILWPTMIANSQWWGPVVTSFQTARREVWLTIDDGPDPRHTPRMIELLARFEARATFFVIGRRAAQFPEQIAAIRAAGHEIANHTFSHPSGSFWSFPPQKISAQIDTGNVTTTPYFRAPVGLKNFFVHPLLARRKIHLIGWTTRGLDTVSNDPEAVAARLLRGARPGAILVLHEGHRSESDPDFHPRCLELTLRGLTSAGYRCVLPAPEQLRIGAPAKNEKVIVQRGATPKRLND